jgi:integrase
MSDVDLACAIRATAFMAGARRLPVRGTVACGDERPRDVCGRVRSQATMPSFRAGKKPNNAGQKYPATPPTAEQVLAMLEACEDNPAGRRLRALLVVLWRAGLRVHEALLLHVSDLDRDAGTVTVRRGKGGKYRVVGMDEWAFDRIDGWLMERGDRYPDGPLFCIVQGPTRGRAWSASGVRAALRDVARVARVPRRVAPHQLRHAHACEMAREGIQLIYVSRQLGHSNIATTATYLQGIGNEEAVRAVVGRPAPAALPSGPVTASERKERRDA